MDVQPTFCEGEKLAVEGSNEVTGRIADYVHEHAGDYAYMATTRDWYIDSEPIDPTTQIS